MRQLDPEQFFRALPQIRPVDRQFFEHPVHVAGDDAASQNRPAVAAHTLNRQALAEDRVRMRRGVVVGHFDVAFRLCIVGEFVQVLLAVVIAHRQDPQSGLAPQRVREAALVAGRAVGERNRLYETNRSKPDIREPLTLGRSLLAPIRHAEHHAPRRQGAHRQFLEPHPGRSAGVHVEPRGAHRHPTERPAGRRADAAVERGQRRHHGAAASAGPARRPRFHRRRRSADEFQQQQQLAQVRDEARGRRERDGVRHRLLWRERTARGRHAIADGRQSRRLRPSGRIRHARRRLRGRAVPWQRQRRSRSGLEGYFRGDRRGLLRTHVNGEYRHNVQACCDRVASPVRPGLHADSARRQDALARRQDRGLGLHRPGAPKLPRRKDPLLRTGDYVSA